MSMVELRIATVFRALLFFAYSMIIFSIGFLHPYHQPQPLSFKTISDHVHLNIYPMLHFNNTSNGTNTQVYQWRCDMERSVKKPLYVIGILSAKQNIDRRTALRKTLFHAIKETEIPFDVIPMFIMDMPSDNITKENNTYKDIMLTYVKDSGWAHSDSRKIHQWYRYVVRHFPNARLVGKMDDDVHLCTPLIFNRLYRFLADNLVYSRKNGKLDVLNSQMGFDEMFVTLEMSLVERLAKRDMCRRGACGSMSLIETGHAGFSFGSWLHPYLKELVQVYDHHRFIHFYRAVSHKEKYDRFVDQKYCFDNVLYHKALPWVMNNLDIFRLKYESDSKYNFSAEYVRRDPTFPGMTKKYNWHRPHVKLTCDNWGVILERSVTSLQFQGSDHLCLVIIAESASSTSGDYAKLLLDRRFETIVFLSASDQTQLQANITRLIPQGHIARKNIGYLYAMQNGAKYIWDFDKFVKMNDMSLKKMNLLAKSTVCGLVKENMPINPYPYLVSKRRKIWPKGFPINQLHHDTNWTFLCEQNAYTIVAITQVVQMENIDTDSLFSLTHGDNRQTERRVDNVKYLVMPNKTYSPVNHKFTIWSAAAFPYLVLPMTVKDTVSDIWRGYIAQHFLSKDNFQTAYVPISNDLKTQRRTQLNSNRYLNFDEFDLYAKADILLQTLNNFELRSEKEYDIWAVYDELFGRDFLDYDDLILIKNWKIFQKLIFNSGAKNV